MAESPVRSGPTQVTAANTSQTITTAGGASTWIIIRELLIVNVALQTITFSVGIGTNNTDSVAKHIVDGCQLPQTGQTNSLPFDFGNMFIPLLGNVSTPDLLYVVCDTANAVVVTVSGVSGP